MDDIIIRPPYFKPKGYLNAVRPIIENGIPRYADSRRDKKVIGTPDWEKFWEEELWKIHNGVEYGGIKIPGRYYYYLNYSVMADNKGGNINPDPDDLHLEIAHLIEYCKANGKNLMMPKARRKGVSEAFHKMTIDYGWRFTYTYKAGVASGNSKYVDGFLEKLRHGWMFLPPELYIHPELNNDDQIIAGYQEKNMHGAWVDAGTRNTIYTQTVHADAAGFKGNYYRDIIVEEIGETEKFLEFWRGTKDALTDGMGTQVGSAWCFGTGGNMEKGSRDFKKAWSRDAKNNFIDSNNFIRFLIPAQRFYFFGGASNPKREIPPESELRLKYKDFQLIGVEDVDLSLKYILKEREELIKIADKEDYHNHLQNNPINEKEIFAKTIINNFDSQRLSDQQAAIDSQVHPRWTKYKLEYKRDTNGMISQPVSVEPIALTKMDDQEFCVWILDDGHPSKGFSDRYCAGIDSYNIDQSKNSKSLGGMCVLDRQTKTPVAVIRCRPRRKEMFYELCLKLSIYYKMYNNVLGDIASDTIMKHFEIAGYYGFLAERPKKFESLNSDQNHPKWVRLTDFARQRMTGLMQAHVMDHCEKIWFPELLEEIITYDEGAKDSDNDLADAYGMALMQDFSYDLNPRNESDQQVDNRFDLPKFVSHGDGMRIASGTKDINIQIQQDIGFRDFLFGAERRD